jgi:superfamily I DNA/RNA helicase
MSARVAIAANYFPAYARIPRKAQRKADEFIRKFQHDPKQSSIHYEPIAGAIDKQLRSVRVGDDYRAIVRAPEQGDLFILLYIDHHDEAYRWAEGKQLQVHPSTGTLQFFDVDEASLAVTSLDAESAAASVSDVHYEERRLFSAYSDQQLFVGGVPQVLLPAVRALHTDTDLDRLVEHLPREAADLLTGLAAGYDYDALLEQILDQLTTIAPQIASDAPKEAVVTPVPPRPVQPIDPLDFEAAIQKESSQVQFRMLDEDFDLEKALSHPLDVWRVYLHPSQKEIVRVRTKGPLRITGGAGTGKTVVAMHRAAYLVKHVFTGPDDRILVTTFTRNLALDIARNLETLLEPEDLTRVHVTNIDAWAANYLKQQGHPMRLATGQDQESAWTSAFDIYGVDGFDLNFCKAEWDAVIQAQGLRDEQAYVRAVRHHRGTPLSRAGRRSLWQLFSEYRNALQAAGVFEPIDIMRAARERLAASSGPPLYRSVVVDETQDLSHEALRLIRAIAGPEGPNDLLLVGDSHQRIYGRPVTLSECGINIRGRRSRELRLNYRTTAAICRWSLRTLGTREFDDLDGSKTSTRGYVSLRQGAAPAVRHFEHKAAEREFIVGKVKELLQSGTLPEEICIVARTGKLLSGSYLPALQSAGIDCEVLERETPRSSSVRLATMHRVKGLEFPIVFVAAANDGFVPLATNDLKSEDPLVAAQAELQERCLLYVATSRARDQLFVTSYETQSPFVAALAAPGALERERAAPSGAPGAVAKPVQVEARGAKSLPALASQRDATPGAQSAVEPLAVVRLPTQGAPAPLVSPMMPALVAPTVPQSSPVRGHGLISALLPEGEANPNLAAPLWFERPHSSADASRTVNRDSGRNTPQGVERSLAAPEFAQWQLPTRMLNWLERNGVRTIDALVALGPSRLREEKNLGRKTIAETDTIIGAKLGSSWHDLSAMAARANATQNFERAAPELASALGAPLGDLQLPDNLLSWATEQNLRTLRDVASRHPLEIVQDPALGRAAVGQIRSLIEARVGRRWEEVQRMLALGALEGEVHWDNLERALPAVILEHSLGEVTLPARMRTYVAREGIETVRALVSTARAKLVSEPNLGRTTVAETLRSLIDYSQNAERRTTKWQLGLLPALKEIFAELETVPRMIVSRRAGLGGAPETLKEIGITLGVSRERIRQIEKGIWDDITRSKAWTEFVREQCNIVAPRGAVSLDELAAHPWWRDLSDEPDALDYFCDHLLAGQWRVVELGEVRYLATLSQKDLDEALGEARDAVKGLGLPLLLPEVERAVIAPLTHLAEAVKDLVWGEIEGELSLDGQGDATRVIAYGSGKRAQVLAFLERQPEPVAVADLIAAVGRGALPDEVFVLAHGTVGLEKHFPDFQTWRKKLAPLAIQLIEENGPERQWSCTDLVASLREELELPAWLEHWHLAAILRRSEGIEYLGRLRVALPGVIADSERIHVDDAARKIIETAGEPVSWESLTRQLRAKLDVTDIALVGLLNRPPFLKVSKRMFGLLARDLPGGVDAMAEALDELEAILERRQRGLSAKFVHKELNALSSLHAQWSQEICLAVVRTDPRFRLTISGNVGLASWENVRVPSKLDIVQEALQKANGRVSVAAVQERIEALYGEVPDRIGLGQMANRFGARLDGEWLAR